MQWLFSAASSTKLKQRSAITELPNPSGKESCTNRKSPSANMVNCIAMTDSSLSVLVTNAD